MELGHEPSRGTPWCPGEPEGGPGPRAEPSEGAGLGFGVAPAPSYWLEPWAPKSRLLVSRADPCLPSLDLPCEWGSAWGEAVHGLTSGQRDGSGEGGQSRVQFFPVTQCVPWASRPVGSGGALDHLGSEARKMLLFGGCRLSPSTVDTLWHEVTCGNEVASEPLQHRAGCDLALQECSLGPEL